MRLGDWGRERGGGGREKWRKARHGDWGRRGERKAKRREGVKEEWREVKQGH